MHRRVPMIRGIVLMLAVIGVLAAASSASASMTVRPRISHAMGLAPVAGSASTPPNNTVPVVYHGGPVMRNVTIHAVFWAPAGTHFDGSPSAGVPGYEDLITQFLGDAAHDSGSTANVFSVLRQYGDGAGDGQYSLRFDPTADTVNDSHPYPAPARQCPSPAGTATCVSDGALQAELDRVIAGSSAERGLSNLWLIFLPPGVDTCLNLGACATSAYAGYHSLFDLGRGPTVYAAIPDPLVELTPAPGSDPEGNPEAESSIDTLAHETVEAITDPDGTGWMDPNGFEIGDKCETGPQEGTPLGYASDGSPYNQLINGHPYLLQYMWSNSRGGCVAGSDTVAGTPGLRRVFLRQFSSQVSGSTGGRGGVSVSVALLRAGQLIAMGSARTRSGGGWGPVTLRDAAGRSHAVGDDRDLIKIDYGAGRGASGSDLISTADGGNPFTQSGYTGWFDLDHGTAIVTLGQRTSGVLVGPCAQTGVLALHVGRLVPESPTDLCQNTFDVAALKTPHIGAGTKVTLSSLDNRGESSLNPNGTLVGLTVDLGEPDSVPALSDRALEVPVGGFPTCTAYLRIRTVACVGLVPGARYRFRQAGHVVASGRAGGSGRVTMSGLGVRGGQVVTLINRAGRSLTALHIARLGVGIIGNETIVASGTCQPGEYWGAAPTSAPTSTAVGFGIGGSGRVCPMSGRAHGLPTTDIAQTDEFSGGETVTQVPAIRSTAPIQDETLYGPFVASAQSGLAGPHGTVSAGGVPIALTITRAGSGQRVFHAADVDTAAGEAVPALAPGSYLATWVLHDAAGDTRTVTTRFTDEG
jgi:hypothetical protein